jgi:glyoxylase-like metal-dependent hydrolase (beta-lactamase superfamily II)
VGQLDYFKFGGFEVNRIEEIVDTVDAKFLLPSLPTEILDQNAGWLAPSHYNAETKQVRMFLQSWLIRSSGHTILVDACWGNNKSRPWYPKLDNLNTPYLDRLNAVGCAPEDVNFVLCTHLHPDHVGWNTRLENGRWAPTFPNAKYVISKKECEPFAQETARASLPAPLVSVYEDSVLPVIAAGQVEQVDGTVEIIDSITIEPAPGHAPGHCIVRVGGNGNIALFTGDAIHSPIQIAYPEVNSTFCSESLMAIQTRRRILEDCAENDHLLVPAHFGPPHVGRIRRRGRAYSFQPGI